MTTTRLTSLIQSVVLSIAALSFSSCTPTNDPQNPVYHSTHSAEQTWLFGDNLWRDMSNHFAFADNGLTQDAVQSQLDWASHHPGLIESSLQDAEYQIQWILGEVKEAHLPAELALLPFVESGYDPFAHSRMGAAGLWQVMPGTASGLGLDINWWFDDRRDLEKSTDSALEHLQYLHHQFHDWLLTVAAYDSGEGTVRKAIKKNQKAGLPTDFWSLKLPKETTHYIPRLLVWREIIAHPEKYHITLPPMAIEDHLTKINVSTQYSIQSLAEWAGMDETAFRNLNAGYRRFATPPDTLSCLYVPTSKAPALAAALETHNDSKNNGIHWLRVTVKAGDTLSQLAIKHHTTVKSIRYANHLKNDDIHIGQVLMIVNNAQDAKLMGKSDLAGAISADHLPGPKQVEYAVKKGDTLSTISKKFRVSIQSILYWNHLPQSATLKPKQELTIWKPYRLPPTHRITITVKPGDYLGKYAKRYHTTTKAIRQVNHLKNDNIRAGQELDIIVNH